MNDFKLAAIGYYKENIESVQAMLATILNNHNKSVMSAIFTFSKEDSEYWSAALNNYKRVITWSIISGLDKIMDIKEEYHTDETKDVVIAIFEIGDLRSSIENSMNQSYYSKEIHTGYFMHLISYKDFLKRIRHYSSKLRKMNEARKDNKKR